jgi:hypothetical protein
VPDCNAIGHRSNTPTRERNVGSVQESAYGQELEAVRDCNVVGRGSGR